MSIFKKWFLSKARPAYRPLSLLLLGGLAVQSQAQIYTLYHNNSSLNIDVTQGTAVVSDWQVDGVNQLNQQWFYYRVGSNGPESPIDSISSATINTWNAALHRLLTFSYANSAYSVQVGFTLTGGTAGSASANLGETITVKNTSSTNVEFHLFQYSDFDLGDVLGGQTVQFYTNTIGQYYKAVQTSSAGSVTETATSAAVPIGHVEAATYNGTLASLTDANPTTLNDSKNAGPDNVTFAYEWDVTLAPGGSFQISKALQVVPEPSALVLIPSGILALAWLHRRRRVA